MINKVDTHTHTQAINNSKEIKELSKKIETIFLTELLKIMFSSTSFSETRTTSTYMTIIIPQIAEILSERDIGIGKFLTENSNFLNGISKEQKIELKPNSNTQQEPKKINLSQNLSLPVSGKITSSFGLRIDPFDGKVRHHNGIDIAVPEGTKIKPVLSGKVVYSGYSNGYGNCVIVEHQDGIQTLYAHNSKNLVKTGDIVTTDTIIALSGSTGRATGPHLHFEVRKDGKPVNPFIALNLSDKASII